MKQIIPDENFIRGFRVLSQKEHNNNERVVELGEFKYGGNTEKPLWKLAQWDSGPCLWANKILGNEYSLSDGKSREVTYNPNDYSLNMRLDTSEYYRGRPVIAGDYWPHLLIEQSMNASPINDKLKVQLDMRLLDYNKTEIEGDYVRAAQFLLFLYLIGRESKEFVWFGLHFFDSRSSHDKTYIGYDGGKADASKALIYSVGEHDIFGDVSLWRDGKPYVSNEWRNVDIDLMSHVENLINYGIKDNYFKTISKPSDFDICGLNIGWETIGTFDHTMEFKNLKVLL